jgi:hypothetical protein
VPVTDGAYDRWDAAAIWASWATQYAPSRFRTGHYLEKRDSYLEKRDSPYRGKEPLPYADGPER